MGYSSHWPIYEGHHPRGHPSPRGAALTEQEPDPSTNEDRFGRQDFHRSSVRSSWIAIIVILIIVGLVYFLKC